MKKNTLKKLRKDNAKLGTLVGELKNRCIKRSEENLKEAHDMTKCMTGIEKVQKHMTSHLGSSKKLAETRTNSKPICVTCGRSCQVCPSPCKNCCYCGCKKPFKYN